jgi:hypothetical protein
MAETAAVVEQTLLERRRQPTQELGVAVEVVAPRIQEQARPAAMGEAAG